VPPVISTRWQLARDAAVRYQDVMVPWILGPFAEALLELVAPRRGEAVLDVGCGTGAATRAAALVVGRAGRVVGLDLNVGMLEVARGTDVGDGEADGPLPASIEWVEASAVAMPLADRSFDVVVSAQALQFIPESRIVAREIRRVLRPEGRIGVTVWRGLEQNPYFAAQTAAVAQRLGDEAASGLASGFERDPTPLVDDLTAAGLEGIEVERIDLLLNLPPLADWAPRHLAATPVASALAGTAPGIARELGADVAHAMADYVTPDGVRVPFSSWVILGRAPSA
jgi:SAM-dependent methyltransferase